MFANAFEYHVPGSVAEAVELLRAHGDNARLLAGGHSLLPAMKLRLASPGVIIDISRLKDLAYVRREGSNLHIGALATHHMLATSEDIRAAVPALADAAANLGDMQVRNRGTLGGVLAHADPAADYPAVLLALGAGARVAGPGGTRSVSLDDWFRGPFTTALGAGEIIIEVVIPLAARTGSAYLKQARRSSDYALCGAAAAITVDATGVCTGARVALNGVGPCAYRATATEQALIGRNPRDEAAVAAACRHVTAGVDVGGDELVSADYRAHLATVYSRRAILAAAGRT